VNGKVGCGGKSTRKSIGVGGEFCKTANETYGGRGGAGVINGGKKKRDKRCGWRPGLPLKRERGGGWKAERGEEGGKSKVKRIE